MNQRIILLFSLLMAEKTMIHSQELSLNDSILETLLGASGPSSKCDILLLPQDQEHYRILGGNRRGDHPCYLEFRNEILSKNARAIIITNSLTHRIVSWSKCPLVVLPTSKEKRLQQVLSVVENTRLPMSLAVVTSSKPLADLFLNLTKRTTFDVQLIILNGTSYSHTYNALSQNEAWKHVRVTFVGESYYSSILGPDGKLHGPDVDLLKKVSQLTGVKFSLESGVSFTGMISKVHNGSADLAISQASVSYQRYNAAGDISMTYGSRYFFMVARTPKAMPASWTLIYPFDLYTWILLGLSIATVALSLIILNQETEMAGQGGHKATGFHIFSISVITLISEALPGSWFNMRKTSTFANILLFTWFMCGLVMSFAYRSTLLASLVLVEMEKPVDTFQELLDNDMTVVMTRGWITTALMKYSPREVVREVYQKCVIEKNGYYTGFDMPPDKYQTLLDGKASYIATAIIGHRHLFIEGEKLSVTPVAMYYTQRFPWKEEINKVIGMMLAGGLYQPQESRTNFRFSKTERDHYRQADSTWKKKLSFKHMQLTWFVIMGGLALSIVVLFWEWVSNWIMGGYDHVGKEVSKRLSERDEVKRGRGPSVWVLHADDYGVLKK